MRWRDPAWRQAEACRTWARMEAFYDAYGCEASPLHRLAMAAVVVGGFWRESEVFARIGWRVSPVSEAGEPATARWHRYAARSREAAPMEVRTEAWLDAHVEDLSRVEADGLVAAFDEEAARRQNDLVWRQMTHHMHSSLGPRQCDAQALDGALAPETAFARGLARAGGYLFTRGLGLLFWYAWRSARIMLFAPRRDARRAVVLAMVQHLPGALRAWGLVRRGLRLRERGATATEDRWPLIEHALGPASTAVHPLLRRFYSNPGDWTATARFRCDRWITRVALWVAWRVTGQGLYAVSLDGEWPARFRVFRRVSGAMHFVREVWVDGQLRVFDSDFERGVTPSGVPAVCERFPDLGVVVPLVPIVQRDGGLHMVADEITWWGRRVSRRLQIRFAGAVTAPNALRFDGTARVTLPWPWSRPVSLGTLTYLVTLEPRS